MNNKELRTIQDSEFRVIPNSRKIEGYALKFGLESNDLGGFKEVISRNSLDGVLEQSDILAKYNHSDDKVLARYTRGKGTLSLNIDEIGLRYSFESPDTSDGNDLYYHIMKGNMRNSSFAFTVSDAGQKWERKGDSYIRTITKFDRLYDIAPCWVPAYQDTTVAVRSLDLIKNENETDKKQYIDDMNERQEISVEVKVEVCEDMMDNMPVDPTEDPNLTDPTQDPNMVDPNMVDPTQDPNMVDPNMVDPNMVDPNMVDPNMVDPNMVDPTQDPNIVDELVDVVIDGEDYQIPKSVLEPYLNNRKLELYFLEIEKSINELKK